MNHAPCARRQSEERAYLPETGQAQNGVPVIVLDSGLPVCGADMKKRRPQRAASRTELRILNEPGIALGFGVTRTAEELPSTVIAHGLIAKGLMPGTFLDATVTTGCFGEHGETVSHRVASFVVRGV